MRGSIVKRKGSLTANGKSVDHYYVVYDADMRWNEVEGRYERNQKWEKVPPPNTRKHAEKLLVERLAAIHRGEFVEPSKIAFREFADLWMQKYAAGQVRPSTFALYEGMFRKHLLPAFGNISLAKVEEIQGFMSNKLASGLARQTVKHLLRLLRQMLDHAVDWDYMRLNPAKKVAQPRIPRREMDFLTADEVRLFLNKVPAGWYAFF